MPVSRLWIYPIKSCGGIAVEQFTLDDRGPSLDRRWMLIEADGSFMTQRKYPRMTFIRVAIDGSDIRLSAPGVRAHSFSQHAGSASMECEVWKDTVELLHVGADTDAWLSEFLGIACRLMRMPQETQRVVDRDYSSQPRLVTLADGFPMLLITTGSVRLLNEKLAERDEPAVTMERFRPNIEVADDRPHIEDEWRRIAIGEVECAVVKPCARCAITTVDLRTGVQGNEPLRTLATYRKVGSKVLFGQDLIHGRAGTIRVGDAVRLF